MKGGRSFVIYLSSSLFAGLLPLLLVPVLTRRLAPEDFGLMATMLTLVTLFSPLVAWGISPFAKVQAVRTDDRQLSVLLTSALANAVIVSAVLTLALLVLGDWIGGLVELPANWVRLVPIVAATAILPQLLDSVLTIRKRALAFGLFEAGNALMNFVLTLVLVQVLTLGWQGRIDALLITNLILSVIALAWLLRMRALGGGVSRSAMVSAWRFGAGVVPHDISSLAMRLGDRLMVVAFVGQAAAGHYAVAAQLSAAMVLLLAAMNRVWVPYVFHALEGNRPGMRQEVVRRSYLIILLFIATFVLFNLALPLIYRLLVAPQYHDSMPITFWLTLGYLFNGVAMTFTNYIHWHGKTRYLAMITIANGLLYLLLARVLVVPWQAEGVAIAFAASSAVATVLGFLVSYRLQPMPWLRPFGRPTPE